MAILIAAYTVAFAVTEALIALGAAALGGLSHACLVLVMINHYMLAKHPSRRKYDDPHASYWYSDALLGFALVPLSRLISLGVVSSAILVGEMPLIWLYLIVGAPMLLAVVLIARVLALSWADLGLVPRGWRPLDLAIVPASLPLSYVAFLLLRPQPLIQALQWQEAFAASVMLTIFAGLAEEVLYRGLLQYIAGEVFGRTSPLWTALLFAIMHLGSGSPLYILFAGSVGLLFGWHVNRYGSLWGVTLTHGALLSGALLIWPLVLR